MNSVLLLADYMNCMFVEHQPLKLIVPSVNHAG